MSTMIDTLRALESRLLRDARRNAHAAVLRDRERAAARRATERALRATAAAD
ncbi:hypothetical protein ACTWP5_07350 [Streptomyces sp. 4N509B]|uniref:hypothetical protein n=1 Tax=Streptomyces sp. 4N509B TaxID=3457413 RepID=UPI003FD18804